MAIAESLYLDTGRVTIRIAVYLMSEVFLSMEVERATTAHQIVTIVQSETELGSARAPPIVGQHVFALWLCSKQLEVQLHPTHRPLELAAKWHYLVNKFGSREVADDEEPVLHFRRNVFLRRRDEEQIKEAKVLELLYAEAKYNVLKGKRKKLSS